MNRVLVIGHRGMLGSALMDLLEGLKGPGGVAAGLEFRGADLPEIDITDLPSIRRNLDEFRPDLVINCAAYTRVDDAESDPNEAMWVNAFGAGNVASAVSASAAKLVHLSTDFVFDGRKPGAYVETDAPAPLGVYGVTKLEGERLVVSAATDFLIVRTAWLYGAGGRNFVTTIAEQAREKPELTVVDDQRGSPTWTRDLARAIWALCKTSARGIIHAAGGPPCSWHEFAVEIVRQLGLESRVRPITSEEWTARFAAARDDAGQPKRHAPRPVNSALDTSLLARLTGFAFPHWHDSLKRFLEEWQSSNKA
jgi:dTDP-4-dehydrorhamnose reductase